MLSVCLFILPLVTMAQVLPKEGSALNYRIIGISFPATEGTGKYKVEIALGNYNSADSFRSHIIQTLHTKDNRVVAEVPLFGSSYTWRVSGRSDKNTDAAALHHFSTTTIPEMDTSNTRLRVLQQAKKYKDAYVFMDGNRAMYDMDGNAVWYLPDIDGFKTEKSLLRDMKLTPQGTITFMYEEKGAYEINLNGDILWKAPNDGTVSGEKQEEYHHEITRLANGHYMVLGIENELWNRHLPSADSSYKIFPLSTAVIADSNKRNYEKDPFGTVIEYDQKGNVVWSWKSSDYFRNSDIYYKKGRNGQPELAAHENSFFFDEGTQTIYIGFRNISRIVKVKYPEGKVLDTYGELYKPDVPEAGNGLFCRQHCVRHSPDGYLYLYDNNSCAHSGISRIVKLEEPAIPGGGLKKIWEYGCTTEGVLPGQQVSFQFAVGGNVTELPDQCLFVNMSTSYSKVFILSPDKDLLWSAIPEKWNARMKRWDMVYQYRASIITSRKDLENLVWSAETK